MTTESRLLTEAIYCLLSMNQIDSPNESHKSIYDELYICKDSLQNDQSEEYSTLKEMQANEILDSNRKGTSNSDETNDSSKLLTDSPNQNIKSQTIQENEFEFIDPSFNIEGRYNYYVSSALESIRNINSICFSEEINSKRIYLKPSEKKFTLVLDIDETLVHVKFNDYGDADVITEFEDLEFGSIQQIGVYLRPGVLEFLSEVDKNFEVLVFTASVREYADCLIKILDPEEKIIQYRLYREDCIAYNNIFIKSLDIIANRDKARMIILDNSIYSFSLNISNGLLIYSFYKNKEDSELIYIMRYLINQICKSEDIREVNESIFGFKSILEQIKYK